jgi:hypothetical protein
MSNPPILFNTVLEVLARTIRQEKSYSVKKEEIKLSLFAMTKCLDRNNPNKSAKNKLELIIQFLKVAKDKINKYN